jgi:hypothetical protein
VSVQLREFLNPLAVDLAYIDTALGVHSEEVCGRKLTELVASAPEASQNLATRTVEDFDLLVVWIDYVQELLRCVGRESHPHGGARPAGDVFRTRGIPGPLLEVDGDILLEISLLVEHLEPFSSAITDVQLSVLAHCDAMHDREEIVADFLLRPMGLPLPQILAVEVKNSHAVVAVVAFSVGNVNVPVYRVNCNTGGFEEACVA